MRYLQRLPEGSGEAGVIWDLSQSLPGGGGISDLFGDRTNRTLCRVDLGVRRNSNQLGGSGPKQLKGLSCQPLRGGLLVKLTWGERPGLCLCISRWSCGAGGCLQESGSQQCRGGIQSQSLSEMVEGVQGEAGPRRMRREDPASQADVGDRRGGSWRPGSTCHCQEPCRSWCPW